ncbi:MAG: outer membrane protein [Alphaproteobacteria bacterium]
MKKTLLATAAVVSLFSFAAEAAPAQKSAAVSEKSVVAPYISAKAVYSWERIKMTDEDGSEASTIKVPGLNAAVGMKIGNVRAELEYGYRSSDNDVEMEDDELSSLEIGMKTFLLNAYYDFANDSIFTPYVGAGVGYTRMSIKFFNADTSTPGDMSAMTEAKTNFSYAANVGVGIKIDTKTTLDIGYRYLNAGHFKFGTEKMKTHANEVSLGIRYDF